MIDVQADLMSHLNTRLVVPLVPVRKAPKPARTLNPLFTLEGGEHVMLTQYAAAIPLSELKREVIDLASRRDEIVSFQGLHRRIGAACIGARQPIAAEPGTLLDNMGFISPRRNLTR